MPYQSPPNQNLPPASGPVGPSPDTVRPVFSSAQPTPSTAVNSGSSGSPFKWLLLVILFILAIVLGGIFLVGKILPVNSVVSQTSTIVYWGLWEPESVMQPVIDKYQRSHPGTKIQYIRQSPQDYRDRLNNSLAQGNGPDIFRFHNTWVPMLKNDLAPVPPKVFDADTFSKTFYPVAQSDLILNGKIMGVPLEYDGLALYYNADIFQQKSLQPPQNWNDLREDAFKLTDRDEAQRIKTAGIALGTTNNVDHWQDILALMMLQANVDLSNPTGDAAEKTLKFYTNFVAADHVWNETLPNSTTMFIQGKLAMYFGPSWRVFDFEEAKRSQNPNLNYGILPIPQLPETNVTWASYWVEGVAKNSKNQDAAWDFIKYLSGPDVLQALFQSESQVRKFGEPYGRKDLADLLKTNSQVNAYIAQASTAKSWYLASNVPDGSTGINARISKYFEDAVNAVATGGKDPKSVLATVANGVSQVFAAYKIPVAPAASQ